MAYTILNGNNIQVLKTFPDNHFDSIVTDPPYGIDFLGKDWDANVGALETYQECLRVLKPGGHILAFSAARTYHHLAITLEQAGFEIRDQIMWIYSSGFPKSQDVGRQIQKKLGVKETTAVKGGARPSDKQTGGRAKGKVEAKQEYSTPVLTDPAAQAWEGWGTALKPAHEPICMARKPLDKSNSIARNCEQWGVGALNIDATRVPYADEKSMPGSNNVGNGGNTFGNYNPEKTNKDYDDNNGDGWDPNQQGRFPSNVIGEIPDYQKYFYCPKVSRRERHMGFDDDSVPVHWDMVSAMGGYYVDENGNRDDDRAFGGKNIYLPHKGMIFGHGLKHEYAEWCKTNNKTPTVGNNHPTVKPIELMKYLIKLITPPGGHILDPFNGSGSTGCAAVELDYDYTGIELDPAYVAIAQRRIAAWYATTHPLEATGLFE